MSGNRGFESKSCTWSIKTVSSACSVSKLPKRNWFGAHFFLFFYSNHYPDHLNLESLRQICFQHTWPRPRWFLFMFAPMWRFWMFWRLGMCWMFSFFFPWTFFLSGTRPFRWSSMSHNTKDNFKTMTPEILSRKKLRSFLFLKKKSSSRHSKKKLEISLSSLRITSAFLFLMVNFRSEIFEICILEYA